MGEVIRFVKRDGLNTYPVALKMPNQGTDQCDAIPTLEGAPACGGHTCCLPTDMDPNQPACTDQVSTRGEVCSEEGLHGTPIINTASPDEDPSLVTAANQVHAPVQDGPVVTSQSTKPHILSNVHVPDQGGPGMFQSTEPHLRMPRRLRNIPTTTVDNINDWHYPMMRDVERAQFYRDMLENRVIANQSVVLDLGAGAGLLSVMAARLGARKVYAIEANPHLARVAEETARANGVEDRVVVINALSTDVAPEHLDPRPQLCVSEIFGTLLLSESVEYYIGDVQRRLLLPETPILPHLGTQYIQLIQSDELVSLYTAGVWDGIDLRALNTLQNTVRMRFTKSLGYRFGADSYTALSDPIAVIDLDLESQAAVTVHPAVTAQIHTTGRVDAILAFWAVWPDARKRDCLTTQPGSTSLARDLAWGQAIQFQYLSRPVQEGETVHMKVKANGTSLHVRIL
jgi:type III protein arginine methyltransferase